MKKIISVILILSLLFALSACAKTGSEAETTTPDATQTTTETSGAETEPTGEHKAVVIYFSRAGEQYGVGTIEKGNTKIVAEMIADKTGADLFEIEPTDSRYDLSYDDLNDYAKKEQADNARPEYKGNINLSSYDTVYLGYPIWWGDLPMIVYSFLENNNFSGKTVYAFCTHAGSGDAGTAGNIAKTIPDAAVSDDLLAIAGTTAQNEQDKALSEVEEWLNEIK
ncbi:MAG: flavodoxin [Ruminococcaceae bacterium]|nr:flavodoxin [Oscillospiraceae bacterium]